MKCRAGRLVAPGVVVLAVSIGAGCSLDDPRIPGLTSPSGFAMAVTLTATPDSLPRDGSAQSIVTVTVRDASNAPAAGQRLTVTTNIGTVSRSEIVTDGDGHATFAFIAPASATVGNSARIAVVPISSGGDVAQPRVLTIALTGVSNSTAPSPAFTVTPTAPEKSSTVRFDASTTTDEGGPCLDACTYSWNFGDGSTGTGRIINHVFALPGTYTVVLTVSDAAGTSASAAQEVTVADVAVPTVTLSVSPESPFVDKQAVFNADAKPAAGHFIQRYEWNFGDGNTQVTTTPAVIKTYTAVGTFVVTVTAVDDLGQAGTAAISVVVDFSAAKPVASFTVSPSSPAKNVTVIFNGSTSTVGAGVTITKYLWNPGDGSSLIDSGATSSTTVTYGSAGTFVITLTITDSLGRQDSKAVTLTVVD